MNQESIGKTQKKSFLPQQNPQVGIVRKMQKYIIGQRALCTLQDMKMLMDKKDQLFDIEQLKEREMLEKTQKIMNNRVIACTFLGGAFILSLQRYFPTKGLISLPRMAADVIILTATMTGGLFFASSGIEDDVYVLKKPLVLARNQHLLEHMVQMNKIYGFTYQQQVSSIFNNKKEKIESWLAGENMENEQDKKTDSVV